MQRHALFRHFQATWKNTFSKRPGSTVPVAMQIMQSQVSGRRLLTAPSGEAAGLQQPTGASPATAAAIATAIANANSVADAAASPEAVETISYLVQAKVRSASSRIGCATQLDPYWWPYAHVFSAVPQLYIVS